MNSYINEILDIDDTRIKEFISLKQSSIDEKYVVVESKNVFKKLFNTNIKIHKIFITIENLEFIKQHCTNIDFPIYIAPTKVMKEIVGYTIHQGMMAVIDKPEFVTFDKIKGNVLVLNSLTSPENIGSIVRSCAAFNVDTIIIDEKTCSPYIRRCIRVSTGNIFNVKIYKSSNLKDDLIHLQHSGYTILSTANSSKAISLNKHKFSKTSAIIIGNEGNGIQKDILEISDNILKIDIDKNVTSLNAAIAASLVLYQMQNI